MKVLDYLKEHLLVLDGGMGTLLQQVGLKPGEKPEEWNISHPDAIQKIHRDYYLNGSNVVLTNTFGANSLHYDDEKLEKIIVSAVQNALAAKNSLNDSENRFVAFDVGPLGRLLKPFGDLDFEEAVAIFAKSVNIASRCDIDLIFIETMSDCYETKAALLAAKENSNLPVFVSNAFGENGALMTGASPLAMIALLEGMGADAIGVNCSFGPDKLKSVAEEYLKYSSLPVILKPNAGLPSVIDGKTVYDTDADSFSDAVSELIKKGVRVVGGCCGTTPDYIRKICEKTENFTPIPIADKNITVVSSYAKTVVFGSEPLIIGERINPTGKKKLKNAIINNDTLYILQEAVSQEEKGAHILDVNVGVPESDEKTNLKSIIAEIQSVTSLPLQIDTSDPLAMEYSMRIYNGKPMVNSVNGKVDVMSRVFPLVKKYGGCVVCLTLDENGIPETVDGRLEIAEKIIREAEKYGIDKKDLIFDTLVMAVSASPDLAAVTLSSMKKIREDFGCHTVLGVSNISFGLPGRDYINSCFYSLALENGLSAAIMNPHSLDMMRVYHSYQVLKNIDKNCLSYIDFVSSSGAEDNKTVNSSVVYTIKEAVLKGLKDEVGFLTAEKLKTTKPLELINSEIIPALNEVGEKYEKQIIYLPQLLMSAEAAGVAFDKIKSVFDSTPADDNGNNVVIATVKGDIHDIGKNIVKLLLENYGFNVIDLGKDVSPEIIVDSVISNKAGLCGLSALMTTTVPSMEETVKALKEKVPQCKVVVGGAVLNSDIASSIGADMYCKDALETVRYAQKIFNKD